MDYYVFKTYSRGIKYSCIGLATDGVSQITWLYQLSCHSVSRDYQTCLLLEVDDNHSAAPTESVKPKMYLLTKQSQSFTVPIYLYIVLSSFISSQVISLLFVCNLLILYHTDLNGKLSHFTI